MKKGRVSIISINYNQAEVTFEMLESFRKVDYPDVEIIVVDNASKNRDIEEISTKYPETVFVKSDENLGFAGGNNLGLKYATGEYIMFLNNDTEVLPDFLPPLIAKLSESEKIGMVCPKIRFHYQPDTIQFAGYTPINPVTIRNKLIGYREKDRGQYNEARQSPLGHGAAMMVKKEVIDKVGPMEDSFFLYYEELDWCTRITRAGYQIWYVPESIVYHKESISTGRESPLKTYYITRNRILYTRRNVKGLKFLVSMLYQSFLAAPKNALKFLIMGRTDLLTAFVKGHTWHIKHLFDQKIKIA